MLCVDRRRERDPRRAATDRPSANGGARAARDGPTAGAAARKRSSHVPGEHAPRGSQEAGNRTGDQSRRAQAGGRRGLGGSGRARHDDRSNGGASLVRARGASGAVRAAHGNLQARPGPISASAALDARRAPARPGDADGRRDGQARSRPHRLAPAHARESQVHARDARAARPSARDASSGCREGGDGGAARRTGAQRPHPRYRSETRSERPAGRRTAGRAAEAAGDAARPGRRVHAGRVARAAAAPVPRRPRLAGGRHGAASVRAGRPRRTASRSRPPKGPTLAPSTTASSRSRATLPDSGIW